MTPKTQAARFRKLADYIQRQPKVQFNQRLFFHPCGTPACIAGHCIEMIKRKDEWDAWPYVVAGNYLGLDGGEEMRVDGLFRATAPWQTQEAAVKELRRRAREIERRSKPVKRRALTRA